METRQVQIGSEKNTKVFSTDERGAGNAFHQYVILPTHGEGLTGALTSIKFQKGPIKENGVNGCMNEDLIAVVIDRLECFNAGDYKCRENAIAITKLEEALLWLRKRTMDRENRGVEGTSVV